jgi:hypothetical protein
MNGVLMEVMERRCSGAHVHASIWLMMYRHDYVLMIAWAVTFLIALPAFLLVGARAAGRDVLGSAVGSALLGCMAGALAGVLHNPNPDSFPDGAVAGAVVGAVAFGILGLAVRDPLARRVKALMLGTLVVGVLLYCYASATSEVVLGWTRQTPDGPCYAPDPNQALESAVACVPKYGLWPQRLLAFDIALVALLFLLQGVVVSSEERKEREAHAVR